MAGAVEITRTHSKVLRMDELLEQIRRAADQAGEGLFLELLRWHRAVVGLPDFDPHAPGSYRAAVEELDERRTGQLLRDLRRASRDPKRHRHGADGKPAFVTGRRCGPG